MRSRISTPRWWMDTEATAAETVPRHRADRLARIRCSMIGFDVEAVAIAVRRALGHALQLGGLTFDVTIRWCCRR